MANTGTLTGTAGSYSPSTSFALAVPAAGDPRTAASITEALTPVANALQALRTLGPHTYAAVTTWTLCATFDDTTGAGNAQRRIYMGPSGDLAIVINATWAEGVTTWTQEEAALPSVRHHYDGAGTLRIDFVAAGTATFADGAWTNAYSYNATTGVLRAEGGFGSNAGVNVSLGLQAGTTVIGAGNVQSTGGFVIGALGVQASGGEVVASAGKVQAQGDPASDEARVECKQFVSTAGAAPTAEATGKTGADNGALDATETVVAGSTDIKGRITVTTGAATGNGDIVRVTFNKAYPTAPEVIIIPTNQNTADLGWVPYVQTATTYFDITSGSGVNKLATGTPYGWAYIVMG